MTADTRIRWLLATCAAVLLAPSSGCDASTPDQPTAIRIDRVLGEPGRSPGQFIFPRGIDAGAEGLWIVDKTGRVQLIDTEWGEPRQVVQMPAIERGLPTGLTVAPAPGDPTREAVWIPDTHQQRVYIIDPASPDAPLAEFGGFGRGPGEFIYLTDVAVLTDNAGRVERIYVSEYGGNDRVSIFDASFRFLNSFGSFGVADDERSGEIVFNRPQSIAIDPAAGELIVADACNHRLGRFSLDGELIAWIGGPGVELFSYPYGIALLEDRRVVVTEFGGNRVSLVELDSGSIVRRFGAPGREAGELASPWGIAVRGEEAFVLDSGNNRIQVFDAPGRPIDPYTRPGGAGG